MNQEFDAIIVGGGPAGCACGYRLAQKGLQTLVVERGKFAGAKNMWGGAFFGPVLNDLIPGFWEEAPIERYVAHQRFSLLGEEACLSMDFTMPKFGYPPYNGFISLRSRFDRWLAAKVEQAGGIVATGLQADDLLWDGNRVVGIRAGDDELPAKAVIACDGVNSLLSQKAKLRRELKPEDVNQGVKEVIELPREDIEQRLSLKDREGLTWQFVGSFTRGLPGGAFVYPNKESLSVGVVVQLKALMEEGVKNNDLLEDFKKHPTIARLLEGGKLVEYSTHLIPVCGMDMMPKLYADGFLIAGDAAAFVLSTGLILEGANFAVASGVAAAETIIKAKKKADFSSKSLAYYQELLEKGFVLKDLKTYRRAHAFLANPRIYNVYPELMCKLAERLFTCDGMPRKRTWDLVRETMKNRVSVWQVAADLIRAKMAI